MLVVIRCDASTKIGSGHAMRCLTIADELRARGAEVEFVARSFPGSMNDEIREHGFRLHPLADTSILTSQQQNGGYKRWLGVEQQQDAMETVTALDGRRADWVIVDHYALDADWERLLRPHARKIMVIDDLANRAHDCDLLLDQTYGRSGEDYLPWLRGYCKLLLGSRNALLRPDFAMLRHSAQLRREQTAAISHIMVSMGSMDETNVTPTVLAALSSLAWDTPPVVDVVLSSRAPHIAALKQRLTTYPLQVKLLSDVRNMAQLMHDSDLAIGAGGTTSWERCCLALPTVLVVLAQNQLLVGRRLAESGAAITLQEDDNLQQAIKDAVDSLRGDRGRYLKLSQCAAKLCDGEGAARVAQELLN